MIEIPSHKIHRMADRILLNKEFEEVHLWMDAPYKVLKGPAHREFRHDSVAVARILLRTKDPKRAMSAILHILLDKSK